MKGAGGCGEGLLTLAGAMVLERDLDHRGGEEMLVIDIVN
jgi:hypothetical protein